MNRNHGNNQTLKKNMNKEIRKELKNAAPKESE